MLRGGQPKIYASQHSTVDMKRRSRGASLASSCSVQTMVEDQSNTTTAWPPPTLKGVRSTGDVDGDELEQLLGASFRSNMAQHPGSIVDNVARPVRAVSAGQAQFPEGGATPEHISHWLRDGCAHVRQRPVTSMSGLLRSNSTAAASPSSMNQRLGRATSGGPRRAVAATGTPISTFITQRSRPSSSTSALNQVLEQGALRSVGLLEKCIMPNHTNVDRSPNMEEPAHLAKTSMHSTHTSSPPNSKQRVGGHRRASRADTTPSGPVIIEASADVEQTQQAIADALQEVVDVAATCAKMATLRGGAAAPSPSPIGAADLAVRGGVSSAANQSSGSVRSTLATHSTKNNKPTTLAAAGAGGDASRMVREDPEVLDATLHALIGAKYSPICVEVALPASESAQPPDETSSGGARTTPLLGQLQIAKTMRDLSTQIVVKTSLARRDRRNCLATAMDALRSNKALHERLKEHVARYDEAARDDDGSVDGSVSPSSSSHEHRGRGFAPRGGTSPSRSFLTSNRRSAADPNLFKLQARMHREERRERGSLARYLREASLESFARELEQKQQLVRGAERSRDRQWMCVLSFIFSTRAVWSSFEGAIRAKEEAEFASLEDIPSGVVLRSTSFCSDPLAKGLQRRRASMVQRLLEECEVDRLGPLVEAMRKTCLPSRVSFVAHIRKVKATRAIKLLLTQLAKSIHTRRNIAALIRNVRCIQGMVRRWLKARRRRCDFTAVQLDHFLAERATYSRVLCQDTKDFEKKKKSSQQHQQQPGHLQRALAGTVSATATVAGPPTTPDVVEKESAASKKRQTSAVPMAASVRRTSAALGGTRHLSRSGSGGGGEAGGFFSKRLEDALGAAKDESNARPPMDSPRKRNALAVAYSVAKPFLHRIAHHNGKRLGADPPSARLAALETHPLYPTAGAKLTAKMRDRLLEFIYLREEQRYRQAKVVWRADRVVAMKDYSWLQELAVVQEKNRFSPAMESLRCFRWPLVPLRRCLLAPNEMRLLVLLGFTLASEEKQQHQSHNHSLLTTAVAVQHTAADSPGADLDDGRGGHSSNHSTDDDDEESGDDDDAAHRVSAEDATGGGALVGKLRGGRGALLGVSAAAAAMVSTSHRSRKVHLSPQDLRRMVERLNEFQAQLNLCDVPSSFLALPDVS